MNPLEKLAAEIKAKREAVAKIYDDLDAKKDEKGELLPLTADDKKSLIDANKEIEDLERQYVELEEREKGKGANQERLKQLGQPVRPGTGYQLQTPEGLREAAKTITEHLLQDEQF